MTNTTNKTIRQLAEEMKLNISSRAVDLSDCIGCVDPSDCLITACRTFAESTITEKPSELVDWLQVMGGLAGFWMESVITECKYCARPAYYDFYDHVRRAWVEMETEIIERRDLKNAIKYFALICLDSIKEIDGYLTEEEQSYLASYLENCANCTTSDELLQEFDCFKAFLTAFRKYSA